MTLTRPPLVLRWALPFVAAMVALVGLPASAAHASAAITGLRVLEVTHSSFTVRLDSQGAGWKYRLFAGNSNDDVFYGDLGGAPYKSGLRSTPKLTVSNLPYRTAKYFWRVQASKNGHTRTGAIQSLGLRPDDVTG